MVSVSAFQRFDHAENASPEPSSRPDLAGTTQSEADPKKGSSSATTLSNSFSRSHAHVDPDLAGATRHLLLCMIINAASSEMKDLAWLLVPRFCFVGVLAFPEVADAHRALIETSCLQRTSYGCATRADSLKERRKVSHVSFQVEVFRPLPTPRYDLKRFDGLPCCMSRPGRAALST